MRTDPAVAAWARALFEVARADDAVDRIDADLRIAVKTIRGHLELKNALDDPAVALPRKAAVITEVLEGAGVAGAVTAVVIALAQSGRAELLTHVQEAYESVSEEVRGVAIADVTTAVELDDGAREKLKSRLAKIAGKDVVLREHVDRDILGGVVVRLGGRIMDGSVRTKLGRMRERMVASRSEA